MSPSATHALTFKTAVEGMTRLEPIGIQTRPLDKALKTIKGDMEFEINGIHLVVRGSNKEHRIVLFDPESVKKISKLPGKGKVSFTIENKSFLTQIKTATIYSPIILLETTPGLLTITGTDDSIRDEASAREHVEVRGEARALYDSRFLTPTARLAKAYETVRVSFQDNYHLLLDYETEGTRATFVVAARED